MSHHFTITTHIVRAQHTRGRPAGAERGRENELRLHVKQYVPKTNPNPKPGDVTIIGAQANGFPKECYEPFWDDLYEKTPSPRPSDSGDLDGGYSQPGTERYSQ
jgi:hypothetical protein